jgi:hypothetical protein
MTEDELTQAYSRAYDQVARQDAPPVHPVYPGGPFCSESCPGPWSTYHDGYADGFAAGRLHLNLALIEAVHQDQAKGRVGPMQYAYVADLLKALDSPVQRHGAD